jgi:hypothetical protein
LIGVVENYSDEGFAAFHNPSINLPVEIEFYYTNGSSIKTETTMD